MPIKKPALLALLDEPHFVHEDVDTKPQASVDPPQTPSSRKRSNIVKNETDPDSRDGSSDDLSTPSPKTAKKADKGNGGRKTGTPSGMLSGGARARPTLSANASPRALFAKMVVDAGLKAVDRVEVERWMGLKAGQQKDMARADGKGALYNALMKAVDGL